MLTKFSVAEAILGMTIGRMDSLLVDALVQADLDCDGTASVEVDSVDGDARSP